MKFKIKTLNEIENKNIELHLKLKYSMKFYYDLIKHHFIMQLRKKTLKLFNFYYRMLKLMLIF